MSRLYRTRGFDKATFDEVARYAPRNTGLFAYFHAPVSTLLKMTVTSMEPAMRQNIEDAFRNTGRYPKLEALIDDLDKGFKDRFAVIIRPNDYTEEPGGPPHNRVVVPAVGIILWQKDQGTIDAVRDLIGCMAQHKAPDPDHYERTPYLRSLHSFRPLQAMGAGPW